MELSPATADSYVRDAFDQMLAVADRLGDEHVNERPIGPTTNAVAALIIHCCGVAEFWLGHVAHGRPSRRARNDEFTATATVAELQALVADTITNISADIVSLHEGNGSDDGGRQFLPDGDTSDASVVIHVVRELYQHLGHMELAADAILIRPLFPSHSPPIPKDNA